MKFVLAGLTEILRVWFVWIVNCIFPLWHVCVKHNNICHWHLYMKTSYVCHSDVYVHLKNKKGGGGLWHLYIWKLITFITVTCRCMWKREGGVGRRGTATFNCPCHICVKGRRPRKKERASPICYCGVCVCVWERERENEWMNEFYFMRVVEKTRGLFTSSPRPWGKLLLTKDTMSYSMLSTCTFIQTMLKWTPVNQETSQ